MHPAVKTQQYYQSGVKSLLSFEKLASARLDSITTETIAAFAAARKSAGLEISSINRELQALRRMFHLAQEWGRVAKALPTVKMLPGERHRQRVLTAAGEDLYFAPTNPRRWNSILTRDCFMMLRPSSWIDGRIEVQYGKTDNARRRIPMTPRVAAILDMRLTKSAGSTWVFAATKSGHIEPSSLTKQHLNAIGESTRILRKQAGREEADFEGFELYTLRHTCLTRWAPHMDPWTLAYLAGHRDMNITKRYVHPQEQTIRAAMDRAQAGVSGHTSGHTGLTQNPKTRQSKS
jgi:integrase